MFLNDVCLHSSSLKVHIQLPCSEVRCPGSHAWLYCKETLPGPHNCSTQLWQIQSCEWRGEDESKTHEQYNIHFPSFLKTGAHEFECLCQIREIFADYDPHFMPMSLDEAYLDFTDHLEQRQNWPESSRTHHYRCSSTATGRAEHFIKNFRAIYDVLCGLTSLDLFMHFVLS